MVLPLGPTPLADAYVAKEHLSIPQHSYPLDLYLCKDCGFSQLLDVVHGESVYLDYIYETTSSLGLVEHFDKYAEEVSSRLGLSTGDFICDIGSNDGTLLRSFKKRGLKVMGVDPARAIAKAATESGIPTKADFFTLKVAQEIKSEVQGASLITANNIFANVDDLASMVTGIKELLAPAGVFVFESFYLGDLVKNMVFDFIYHEHLSAFSVKPVQQFFKRFGMELFDVQRIPTKGGSLRFYIQNSGGTRPVTNAVHDLIALEKKEGIQDSETFTAFRKKIGAAKAETVSLLKGIIAKGQTVAGYGASATTTTLLYHFGITEMISFIADDYPVKHNLFSPKAHIPVLPSSALYEKKPDYVFIIAWRYFEPIINKHREYQKSGGKFIVPLPTLKVL